MTLWKWSRTPSTNATADSTCPFPEGMAPSAVNDGVRGLMAAAAKYRDDMSGALLTTGTSTAYSILSYQGFDSLAHLDSARIAFTPHVGNGAIVTLNVDGLGAKPLRTAPGVELLAGAIIQGTPYVATYNNSDGAFYLHGFFGNPYNLPLGGAIDYFGSVAPNSSLVFPYGQAISRTTYATLFSLFGIAYGAGDGSTTFNIPDIRGRVIAGKDDMGGAAAARLSGTSITSGGATTLGGSGGGETRTLVTGNLPPYTPAGTITNGSISISHNAAAANSSSTGGGGFQCGGSNASIGASQAASTFTGSAQGGMSTPFAVVQPTIVANKVLRII